MKLTNKQLKLFDNFIEVAPIKHIFIVSVWWYIFRRHKFKKFIFGLDNGKYWVFAYKDAK